MLSFKGERDEMLKQSNIDQFFQTGTTQEISQKLLGKIIVYHQFKALIVETEAYLGQNDQAAHAFRNHKTHRNRALFMRPGTIYIFSMYGHNMLNFITQPQGTPEGILIRAVQPLTGIAEMQKQRHTTGVNLTNGPGKLCDALQIPMSLNTKMLNQTALKLVLSSPLNRTPSKIGTSGRIGVPHKGKWTTAPLRYFVSGNPYVSKMPRKSVDHQFNGWQK